LINNIFPVAKAKIIKGIPICHSLPTIKLFGMELMVSFLLKVLIT
jgi:hypothetical protein